MVGFNPLLDEDDSHWWPKISVWGSAATPSKPVPADNVALEPVCDPIIC